MENKKGSGIFLGVVAVATLVVAIIGATFAYFSITAQSENDAVNLTAYEFNASLSVNPLYPTGNYKGLIPLDPDHEIGENSGKYNLLYAINESSQKCVDDAGYQVCQVLELTFENTGNTAMTLTGTLRTAVNDASVSRQDATAFTDLKVRTATGTLGTGGAANSLAFTTTEVEGNDVVDTYAVPSTVDDTVSIGTVTVPAATDDGQGGTTNGTTTLYVVVYLDGTNDTNSSGIDQSTQMGATYQGQLIFASSAGNKLTGTFSLGNG